MGYPLADGGSGSDDGSVSVDRVLELLSQYQRREMIRFLRESSDRVQSLDDVIDHLANAEKERFGTTPGRDHLLSVIVHIHGPKLEEAGLLEYDVRRGEIRYMPNERIERFLDRIDELADEE